MTLPDLACRTGTLARRLLEQAGRGKVLASCTGAIFLLTESGAILWIQGRDAPMHRRAIGLAVEEVPRTEAGVPFLVERETLQIGPSIRISPGGAPLWEPVELIEPVGSAAAAVAAVAASPEKMASRIREFFGMIDTARARELGSLIPSLRRSFEGGRDAPVKTGDPVLDAATPHAIGAALAVRDRDAAALEDHARALVGLGRGLTPSGDDFIGGLLFVLRRVPGICPVSFGEGFCTTAGGWVDLTNAISFALLGDHAAGHGNAFEHEIVSGLCEAFPGTGHNGLRAAVERLVRIGHSSGWDYLAGMVAALSAFRESA